MPLTISVDDLATVRRSSGATVTEIPDAAIDAIYINTAQGNSSVDYTTYYTLFQLLGVLSPLVDKSSEVDNFAISARQRFENVENLLARWAARLGIEVHASADGAIVSWSQDW